MKILMDENIPFGALFFERFGEVVRVPGRTMTAEQVRDADALIIRSVTKVNEQLLAGSRIQFVGTCTIGIDHIDTEYLTQNKITYASAPGCNALGVVQYDLAALTHVDLDWREKKIGVIGCGNVGKRLCEALAALAVNYVVFDPFLSPSQNSRLTSFDEVLGCDIVCMHAPYTNSGPHSTHHMINAQNLVSFKPGAILLNAGRGGTIDNQALLSHLRNGADMRVILDVWEHEPRVDLALMEQVVLGSPHIAGYSFEGKINGAAMVYSSLVKFLGLDERAFGESLDNLMQQLRGQPQVVHCNDFAEAIASTYDITADDARFRQGLQNAARDGIGSAFDQLRKSYPERRELNHFRALTDDPVLERTLKNIGFLTADE